MKLVVPQPNEPATPVVPEPQPGVPDPAPGPDPVPTPDPAPDPSPEPPQPQPDPTPQIAGLARLRSRSTIRTAATRLREPRLRTARDGHMVEIVVRTLRSR